MMVLVEQMFLCQMDFLENILTRVDMSSDDFSVRIFEKFG